MRNKTAMIFFAFLSVSVIGYLAFSIYPLYNDTFASQDNQQEIRSIPIPGDTASEIGQRINTLKESFFNEDMVDNTPLFSIIDLYTMMEVTHEQAALLKRYILNQNSGLSDLTAIKEASAFLHYSTKYNIPLDLAVAVANTESHFDPEAKSSHGSAGVMQVTWRVHSALLQANGIMSEDELHEPEKGIAAGCLLISRYLKAYGNTQKALGRYYGGSASVYWSRISRNLAKLRKFTN